MHFSFMVWMLALRLKSSNEFDCMFIEAVGKKSRIDQEIVCFINDKVITDSINEPSIKMYYQ